MRPQAKPVDQSETSTSRVLTWAALVMVLLSLPLLFNFVSRVQAEDRMATEAQRSADQVRKAETYLAQLRQALAYAKTDAFTEEYARVQARYARPGEIVVVPPNAQTLSTPAAPWWDRFIQPGNDAPAPANSGGTQQIDKSH